MLLILQTFVFYKVLSAVLLLVGIYAGCCKCMRAYFKRFSFYSNKVFCGCVILFLGSNPSLSFLMISRSQKGNYQCDSDLNLACLWEGEFPPRSFVFARSLPASQEV